MRVEGNSTNVSANANTGVYNGIYTIQLDDGLTVSGRDKVSVTVVHDGVATVIDSEHNADCIEIDNANHKVTISGSSVPSVMYGDTAS